MVWNGFVAMAARFVVFGLVVGAGGLVQTVAAQGGNDITLTLSSTTAEAGDTVELTLSLTTQGAPPASLIVFLDYDPMALTPATDEYELILRNSVSGEPILDNDGNTMVIRRGVRPSDGVTDAGKTIDSEVFIGEGVVGVTVTGLNATTLPNGVLFTYAFNVAANLTDGALSDVLGISDDDAVVVVGSNGQATPVSTSASGADESRLVYTFVDAMVQIGCEAPVAPTNITATQSRADAVGVNWSAVAGAGVEYRVYRSTSNNIAASVPVGEDWQSGTSFNDITALVPEIILGDGCTVPDQVSEVHYFYWVRARSGDGCQGLLSATSAEGFRIQTAAKTNSASLVPPGSALGTGLLYFLALSVLFGYGRVKQRNRPQKQG